VVATVCIGAFMGQLDASIVTIALPRIGHDLHASVGAVEWVAVGGALYTAGGRLPLSMAALGATSLLVGAALHLHDSRE
jgi:MFS family permease